MHLKSPNLNKTFFSPTWWLAGVGTPQAGEREMEWWSIGVMGKPIYLAAAWICVGKITDCLASQARHEMGAQWSYSLARNVVAKVRESSDCFTKVREVSRKFAQIRPVNPRCYA